MYAMKNSPTSSARRSANRFVASPARDANLYTRTRAPMRAYAHAHVGFVNVDTGLITYKLASALSPRIAWHKT